jgi:hypothetical protein
VFKLDTTNGGTVTAMVTTDGDTILSMEHLDDAQGAIHVRLADLLAGLSGINTGLKVATEQLLIR